MKTRNLESSLLAVAVLTAFAFMAGNVVAQDSISATAQPAVASQPTPQLSYGVPQVLQLVQAKISDGIIVNYIQNSGTIYSLSASEIVYLKQQGASDNVLNAMLNQRSRVSGSTEAVSTTASASAPVNSAPASSDQNYTAAAPSVTYVQQAAQPSTVYVVPNTQTYYYSYPYYTYPYYGGYYYGWPGISLSFGWGSYHYNGGSYYYHGGYYGGWHGSSGGSWHGSSGGGSWGGGGGYHSGGGHH